MKNLTGVMREFLCDAFLRFLSSGDDVEGFYSTIVTNCVLNSFLSYTAVMLNFVTIYAITKTSSLLGPLRMLLTSLVVSDLGVGLLVQPFYVALMVMTLQQQQATCITYSFFAVVVYLFSGASFLSIICVSVDGFLAIRLNLRYQELVTSKRVTVAVILVWLLCFTSYPLMFAILPPRTVHITFVSLGLVCILLKSMVFLNIYFIVRRHSRQIQAQTQQLSQNGAMSNTAKYGKSALSLFYLYLLFLVCYLPQLCAFIVMIKNGKSSWRMRNVLTFTMTWVFLKSSLNPVICFWKVRHIRRVIMISLRKLLPT